MRIRVDGDPNRAADMHWRGFVLTNFDGKRWFTPVHDEALIPRDATGSYFVGDPIPPPGETDFPAASPRADAESYTLHYTVLMEPIATDAIFIAPRAVVIRGRFGAEAGVSGLPTRPEYLLLDRTGSVSNPLHNNYKMSYEGFSRVPADSAPRAAQSATADYPAPILENVPATAGAARSAHSSACVQNRGGLEERIRQSREYRALPEGALRLHARSFRAARQRSAREFSFREARRPLRILCLGDDDPAAIDRHSRALRDRASFPANTTISAATTSFAKATRTRGWKCISRTTDG